MDFALTLDGLVGAILYFLLFQFLVSQMVKSQKVCRFEHATACFPKW
jgi:hypothetical protein